MNILETVLAKMLNINKANYRNLNRYSNYHEKSYYCSFINRKPHLWLR